MRDLNQFPKQTDHAAAMVALRRLATAKIGWGFPMAVAGLVFAIGFASVGLWPSSVACLVTAGIGVWVDVSAARSDDG